jgi:hypothetical protein
MRGFYDRQGSSMEMMDWARRFSDEGYKRVAHDVLNGSEVSTVWLGADHGPPDGPRLIFETMVFGGPLDGEMDRYGDEEAARLGHARMVEAVRAGAALSEGD